jgi:PAS domain S-box-containing protein
MRNERGTEQRANSQQRPKSALLGHLPDEHCHGQAALIRPKTLSGRMPNVAAASYQCDRIADEVCSAIESGYAPEGWHSKRLLSHRALSKSRALARIEQREDPVPDLPEIPFESFFRRHDVVMLLIDADTGQVVDANDAALRFYGHGIAELQSVQFGALSHLPAAPCRAEGQPASAPNQQFSIAQHRSANGAIRTVEVHTVPIPIAAKTYLLKTIHDITHRTKADEALRQSEERFRAIFDSTFQFTGLVTPDGILLETNRAALDFAGVSAEDTVNRPFWETRWWLGDEARVQQLKDAIARAAKGEFVRYEVDIQGARDTTTTIDFSLKPVFDSNGAVTLLVPEGRDITHRRLAESQRQAAIEALRVRESHLSAIIENQPGLIWLKDRAGRFLAVNTRFANSCGLDAPEALVGKTDWDVWPQELAARYVADDEKVMLSAKPCMVEEPISDRGTISWFETFKTPITDAQGVVTGTTGYARDITERKRMEVELQKAQKLDSLGVLAGGIAHDFNNLLTGIFGYIDLARSVSRDAQTIEYLESTLASMNRARSLTLQLLTFAKGGAPVQKVVPLVPFIQEAVQFALSGSNVACHFALADGLWLCNIDRNQIAQVVDNIVINAVQAMPSGGLVEVVARNASMEEGAHHALAKGHYVRVSVKDCGIGIPADILPRIFDPFYTTKPRGHGLGLATCYSIVRRHGGCIDVESEAGKGSTFHVYLPASEEKVVAGAATGVTRRGSGRIMVVDDDEVILGTVRKMLASLGYAAECRKDGREAVDFYIQETKAGRHLSGMILDLTIPGGMGGREAVAEIRKLDGALPVFVASGYADDPVMKNPAEYGFTASLSKPFTIAELSDMLNGKM